MCESVSTSHLCNCASTRCLQRGKVDGLITGLALGVERHFHAERLAHNNILVAFLVSRTSSVFIPVTYLISCLPLPPPVLFSSFLLSCKWRNTSETPVVMSSIFPQLLFVVFPPASPLVCLARCATVVWQPGSFLSFPFDASRHISLEQASASWEQNSCLVSGLLCLTLPLSLITLFPLSALLCAPPLHSAYSTGKKGKLYIQTFKHALSHVCRHKCNTPHHYNFLTSSYGSNEKRNCTHAGAYTHTHIYKLKHSTQTHSHILACYPFLVICLQSARPIGGRI